MKNKSIKILSILVVFCLSCSQQVQENTATPLPQQVDNQSNVESGILKNAKKILSITQLGSFVIDDNSLSTSLKSLDKSKKVFIVNVDNLSIGENLNHLDEWNIAFENGLVKGLINSGFEISEKLDFVRIRNKNEYLNTNPDQAFYMHSIDLDSHEIIKSQYSSSYLFEYQIVDFSLKSASIAVYIRIVDLNTMKIVLSQLVSAGSGKNLSHSTNNVELYNKIFNSIQKQEFSDKVVQKFDNAALLNIDILNVKGNYSTPISKKLIAIENGIVSGLVNNDVLKSNFLREKTTGFKLKYPSVYNNIVFNTNPILYEEWDEFVDSTNCSELIMYRYLEDEGVYFRFIDANDNGKILASSFINFSSKKDIHSNVFQTVKAKASSSIDFAKLKRKRIMVIDGDNHSSNPTEYFNNRSKYNEMQFAIEEGILASLVQKSEYFDFQIIEKLQTLYLKRPWMYNEKVFNLNPLYLDNWEQLKVFGVDALIIYNNLIPYHEIMQYSSNNSVNDDLRKVVLSYKIINLENGNIMQVGEINN